MATIELDGVSKTFENGTTVFENLCLSIEVGKTTSIVGSSGCGKTTLLNLLAGLEPVTGGRIIADEPLSEKRFAYLFQEDALLPWRTGRANALFGLECHGDVGESQLRAVDDYLARFGVADQRKAWPSQMSGGQRQRIALIQSLVCNPDILILDEPFSSLDYQTKLNLERELMLETRKINSGTERTVVLVTHDIEEAICLADTVVVLGAMPSGVAGAFKVVLSEDERDPVKSRYSINMRNIFREVWGMLANNEI
ncbi:MAG: ATP-binding cassette domain-containing protein [Gammaproteobacteria bacterium]|nr:ATP-binding cassette domain-containing protein [Gammaproteobacteria bacterium]